MARAELHRAARHRRCAVEQIRGVSSRCCATPARRSRNCRRVERLTLDAIYARDASVVTPRGVVLCCDGKGRSPRRARGAGRGVPRVRHRRRSARSSRPARSRAAMSSGSIERRSPSAAATAPTTRASGSCAHSSAPDVDVDRRAAAALSRPARRVSPDVDLSPVDDDLAVVYSPLMPVRVSRVAARSRVSGSSKCRTRSSSRWAPTCWRWRRAVSLMLEGNPVTQARLEAAGAEVVTYDGSEISVKGGGGPTCLTRPLDARRAIVRRRRSARRLPGAVPLGRAR